MRLLKKDRVHGTKVFLEGDQVADWVEADDTEGWVEITTFNNLMQPSGSEIRRGMVRIQVPTPEPLPSPL